MTQKLISLGILGARGKMGQMVLHSVSNEFQSVFSLFAEVGSEDAIAPLLKADVVIDFSAPHAMLELAQWALQSSKPIPAFVVGSTGWNKEQNAILEELAKKTPLLMGGNFSVGAFLLAEMLREFSPLLRTLAYRPVLIETHHQHKKDAPSGTALMLQEAIDPKNPEVTPVHSIRAGSLIGHHEVTFYSEGDQITLGHFAQDRAIFARGALEMAQWLVQQKAHFPRRILLVRDYFSALQRGLNHPTD